MNENNGKLTVFMIKKRAISALVALFALTLAFSGGVFLYLREKDTSTARPLVSPIVVLDAGHGGIDAGVTGKGGLKESDFNLQMVFLLRDLFSEGGFSVVLTRKDENGLYGDVNNFKRADMAARKEIIVNSSPDLVLSIHANKFPTADRRGAQVFYDEFNPSGKGLAGYVQEELNELNEKEVGRKYSPLSGDYYVLKCSHAPSVIVECGFLSNPADEALLKTEEYRKKLAEAIFAGTAKYLLDADA